MTLIPAAVEADTAAAVSPASAPAPVSVPDPAAAAAASATSSFSAPVRLAVVIGSNRDGRFGPVVADWLLSRLGGRDDIEAEVIDLAEADLPTVLSARPAPEVVAELGKVTPKLAGADAFVVLTPEYNHSFPAALKSLIDWHFTEWQAKPVGFVSYGGVSGGLRAVEHLRQVFAELHAVTVRDTVSFQQAGSHFDDAGHHRDPAVADAAVRTMLDQLVWWAVTLREAKEKRPYGR